MIRLAAALLATATAPLATAAMAEGARLVFDCTGDDGAGISFIVAPLHTDPSGKGPIEVTYRGETYPGVAASDHGPFQFGTDTEHFALLVHGMTEDGRLDMQLHHAGAGGSTLTPYTCETNS
ncbi:hypothetical protein [Sinisalibacter aestuarii]|uniref:Uncharacterized protein n=1 Tax=Sinisalibacter aestuarii TaxID=2949426 RepID=A0ABQ5LVG1_9RHOB|nr:hypothetical protein [Sinisalibacter aestuarii]GKY88979.1 hypothetical protein STA1M1_28480 [Sinisalibacter aestuarii]